MRQINFGMTLSLLLVTTLLLSSCSSFYKPEKEIVTVTKLVEKQIPTVPHPKKVQMNEIKIYVVSPSENFEKFKEEGIFNNLEVNTQEFIENYNNSCGELFSIIFVWGKRTKEIIENHFPKLKNPNLIVTGHPSIDLLSENLKK